MKTFIITYHLFPDAQDVVVEFSANTEDEVIAYAKAYRKDSFSIAEKNKKAVDTK